MSETDDYLAITPQDRTSGTDDERIERIVPLPPPAHLIRFFIWNESNVDLTMGLFCGQKSLECMRDTQNGHLFTHPLVGTTSEMVCIFISKL
jgi:hypothetical protein